MSVDFRTVKGKHRRVGLSLISELKRGRCIPGRKINIKAIRIHGSEKVLKREH